MDSSHHRAASRCSAISIDSPILCYAEKSDEQNPPRREKVVIETVLVGWGFSSSCRIFKLTNESIAARQKGDRAGRAVVESALQTVD